LQYGPKGFTVLGFPCNQFGAQEPGTDAEIFEFAQSKYDVNFPMFHKIKVNGPDACELYKFLREQQPAEDGSTEIPWNFAKFLVDGEGKVLRRFHPKVTPEQVGEHIASLLA